MDQYEPHYQKGGSKKLKHPHHLGPKPESGYTDEAAEECHDLIDRAEEEAHLHEPGSMYSTESMPSSASSSGGGGGMASKAKGGLESTGSTAGEKAQGMGGRVQETGKHVKTMVGEKFEHMKEAMHMKK
ncbi:hypothetical protein VTK56DRAFT_9585 [Thermocarpiscus australiensis]